MKISTSKHPYIIVCLFGAISGFTLVMSGNTLNYWLAKESISLEMIGGFAMISLPYAINFLWAPILDSRKLGKLTEILGQRLAWICLVQFFLGSTLLIISTVSPSTHIIQFAVLGFIISFLSSTQDALLGAIRTEIISKEMQGEVSGIYILGYRIGMLLSGSFAIYLSIYLSWQSIYRIFALFIIFFMLILIFYRQYIQIESTHSAKVSGDTAGLLTKLLHSFGNINFLILILLFLITYRLADNFIYMMINPFLLHIGYDEFEIASGAKMFGIAGAIIGGVVASIIMRRVSILNSLLLFGTLHGVGHLLFLAQEYHGKNLPLLFSIIGFESITGGMAMASYIGLIAYLCQGEFRATQYAFLSAMMGLSRAIFPCSSGYLVVSLGWQQFFIIMFVMSIPSLLVLLQIKRKYNSLFRPLI